MRGGIVAIVITLTAGMLPAQESAAPAYAPKENPFMAELPFVLAQPVALKVEVEGVRFDAVTVTPIEDMRSDGPVRCSVELAGENAGEHKARVSMVLLLEEESGRALDRVKLDEFKSRYGRPFDETQRRDVPGEALGVAQKVYVYIEVS